MNLSRQGFGPRLLLVLLLFLGLLLLLAADDAAVSSAKQLAPKERAPRIRLHASPRTINTGELTLLEWSTTGADLVRFTPQITEEEDEVATNGRATDAPEQTTTYVATAIGPGGTTSAKVTVHVNQVLPTVKLSTTSKSALPGEHITLRWLALHARELTIEPGIGKVEVPAGSMEVKPSATTTYTATARGLGGTVTATTTVNVARPGELAISLRTAPQNVAGGQETTLAWVAQNATEVTISPDIGRVSASGVLRVKPKANQTYIATARDINGNTRTAQATVTAVSSGTFQSRIKHIIVYMQENRSFDHYFGRLGRYREMQGLPKNIDGMPLDVALPTFDGDSVKPFHFQTACHDNTSPAWNESHFFVHRIPDGTFGMDFWMMQQVDSQHSTIDPDYTRTMGYYDWTDLPYYYDLATKFATSDRFYSSLMGATVPNRIYLFAGTSAGRIRPEPGGHAPYALKTIFDQLTAAGIRWRYYYQDGSVFLAEFDDWDNLAMRERVWPISNYYSILASPDADSLLPEVVFIEQAPKAWLNEHPTNPWGIQPGAANTKKLIDALMNSAAWQSSMFILTYDEGGGLRDHVPPYSVPNPDGIAPKFATGDIGQWDNFTYSGFRIPFVVVSPWVKKNYVSHTRRDFGAILRTIQKRFGLPALTERDRAAGWMDLTEFFNFDSPSWLTLPTMAEQPYRNAVWVQKMREQDPAGTYEVDPAAKVCNRQLEVAPGHTSMP